MVLYGSGVETGAVLLGRLLLQSVKQQVGLSFGRIGALLSVGRLKALNVLLDEEIALACALSILAATLYHRWRVLVCPEHWTWLWHIPGDSTTLLKEKVSVKLLVSKCKSVHFKSLKSLKI